MALAHGHPIWSLDRGDWVKAGELSAGERVATETGYATVESVTARPGEYRTYNLDVEGEHRYLVGELGVAVHNVLPGDCSGNVKFGKNFEKKVRKHIDQVRNRGPIPEDIPSPGKGGIEWVKQIILKRVAQGGGRETTYAGEKAIAFEDGGVTYMFRENMDFWTILAN